MWVLEVYEGKKVEGGKKWYGVSLVLEEENGRVKEKEIEKVMEKVIGKVEKGVGGVLG